ASNDVSRVKLRPPRYRRQRSRHISSQSKRVHRRPEEASSGFLRLFRRAKVLPRAKSNGSRHLLLLLLWTADSPSLHPLLHKGRGEKVCSHRFSLANDQRARFRKIRSQTVALLRKVALLTHLGRLADLERQRND